MGMMQRDSAVFIDQTMNYLGSLLNSDRIAFYQVVDDQRMIDFALKNIDSSFHHGYLDEMHVFDPLHVSRLNRGDAPQKLYHLWRQERDCLPETTVKYRSFLNCFEVSDVLELLFRFEGHVVAGASILYRDLQPAGCEPAHLQAAHAYIEFNLEQYIRQSGQYLRMALSTRFGLSSREIDVIELICCGRTNSEIAELLQIGMATVKTHLIRIYQKLGVENRASVVAFIAHLG
ncbi:DNA-binding CsgD family transcriptional regulator [Rhizobium sp. SG_E_25_P2]|uniref:helix-turn-helix transcriptional regulator n=1 Tax=Rhizobium sp. SG_E_25_P2 TaxID=2879942 RepID=UPI002475AEEB|nr:helix-turn-helix transcriptional regulator [Rhizobium sp. SG_E_25_P2]MDH6269591.1 DNA-binding CsgD family transcriptional regulator [Rhizobium sp. SG_E_25_P2]